MNTSANTRKKRAVTFCSPILMTISYNPFAKDSGRLCSIPRQYSTGENILSYIFLISSILFFLQFFCVLTYIIMSDSYYSHL